MTMMTPLGQGGRMYPRSRRWPRIIGAVLVVALLAAVGFGVWWWFTQRTSSSDVPAPSATKSCHTPTPSAPKDIPPVGAIEIDVANGTDQAGLAVQTADQLTARGFDVMGIGNTDRPVRRGAALVRYADADFGAAVRVASYVPGATLVSVAALKGRSIQMWIGPDFQGIASK
ncbi:MAG TPA: LytR C-terminal domain-containing protein, partial [Actinomycetes bacterium]|nr:LytR C-terminal domain-containing protein [Actinomycetes bacterium]